MVPVSFHDFFSGCATIAGALIGLLFVALSVSPEHLRGENARTDHALQLEHTPDKVSLVGNQGELALCFFLFGIARSWQLVGAREFGLVTAMASMVHRAAGNGPHLAGGDQPGSAGAASEPVDPGTGHASA